MLEGAHFLTRERGPEVNQLIKHVVMHGRRLQVAGCSTRFLQLSLLLMLCAKFRAHSSPNFTDDHSCQKLNLGCWNQGV